MVRQQDPQGSSAGEVAPAGADPAEGFGGEITSVTPDGTSSSRWDRNAVDEDALLGQGTAAEPAPVEDARTNGDVAGL